MSDAHAPRILILPAVAAGLLLVLTGAAATAAQDAPWITATGIWDGHDAEARWRSLDGAITDYHVSGANGTAATCLNGAGTLRSPDGAGGDGSCGGDTDADANTTTLWFEAAGEGARWEGHFIAAVSPPIAPAPMDPITVPTWAAALLLAIAVLGVGGSGALAFLWQRERALTLHLAKRLAALRGETAKRGRGESDKDRVARILVRSRN